MESIAAIRSKKRRDKNGPLDLPVARLSVYLKESCLAGVGNGKEQKQKVSLKPEQSRFKRKWKEMAIASSESAFQEFFKRKQRNETLDRKREVLGFFKLGN